MYTYLSIELGYGFGIKCSRPYWQAILDARLAGGSLRLQQAQLAGTRYSFGAPLHLQFIKDDPVVPFHRAQGKEKPLTDLAVRESLGNEPQHFQLAFSERFDECAASWLARFARKICSEMGQQPAYIGVQMRFAQRRAFQAPQEKFFHGLADVEKTANIIFWFSKRQGAFERCDGGG